MLVNRFRDLLPIEIIILTDSVVPNDCLVPIGFDYSHSFQLRG